MSDLPAPVVERAVDAEAEGAPSGTLHQEFGENGMDLAHFPFLHHQQTAAIRTEDVAAEGPVFRHRTWQRYAIFGLARLFVREVSGPLEVELAGPGCALNRAGVSAGIELRYLYQFFFTPLDEERVEMVSQIAMRRVGGQVYLR